MKAQKTKVVLISQNSMKIKADRWFNDLNYTKFIVEIVPSNTYFNWLNNNEKITDFLYACILKKYHIF